MAKELHSCIYLVDAYNILDHCPLGNGLALLKHGLCHLHMWLILAIRVFMRCFGQRLGYNVLLNAQLIILHFLVDTT